MNKELFAFQMKRQLPLALRMGLLMALLSLGAVLSYTDANTAALSELRAGMPGLFAAFGVGGSASLLDHVASLLHGFLFPLLGSWLAARLAARLLPALVESGELSYYLSLPIRRENFVLGQGAALFCGLLLACLTMTLGTLIAAFALRRGEMSIVWLLSLSLGQLCIWLFAGGMAMMVASGRNMKRGTVPRSLLLPAAFFAIAMVSAVPGVPAWLARLTPYSLFQPQNLARGRMAAEVLTLPLIGLICLLIGMKRFARRDLPL